jgi:hypothetical protein
VTGAGLRPITYDELLTAAQSLDRRTLTTVTGRRFRVGVYLDSIVFTPRSTGGAQSDGRRAGERFVARYNEIRSLRPGDYSRVTRNASYSVPLVSYAVGDDTRDESSRI